MQRGDLVEHRHTSKEDKRNARPGWRGSPGQMIECRGLAMDEAVGNGANRKQRGGRGRERRGLWARRKSSQDLPVCLRCGKRRLPIGSIRASSGYCIKDVGVRGGNTREEGKKTGKYQV